MSIYDNVFKNTGSIEMNEYFGQLFGNVTFRLTD